MKCGSRNCKDGLLSFKKSDGDIWYECDKCNNMGIVPKQTESAFYHLVGNVYKQPEKKISLLGHYTGMRTFRSFI